MGATAGRYFKKKLAIKDLRQKRALGLVAISVVLLGCFSVQTVANEPVKIMPLGDSITKGFGTTPPNGYRKPLYLNLISSGYNVDFVGGETHGDFADPNHEGHGGWHAEEDGSVYDINDQVYGWLVATPPDIILLHIGTNDISAGGEDASEINDILNEIDRYEAYSNEVITVILALIIDRAPHSSATTQFNIDVNAVAQSRIAAGDDIIVVDMESALNYVNDMYDGTHPNDVGYAKMANIWYSALDNYLNAQRTLTCSSTIGGSVIEPGEGSFVYDYGTDVNLIASADPDYYFANWTGTAVDADKVADPDTNSTTVLMDANYTVVANFAADRTWDDGGDPNELWSEPNNWDPDGIPTIADSAKINMADANCVIDSTVTAVCNTLIVGYDNDVTKSCTLMMSGGSLKTGGLMSIGDGQEDLQDAGKGDGNGVFIMSGGDVNVGGRLWVGMGAKLADTNATYGTFIMSGGVFNVDGDKLELGKNPRAVGVMHLSGGTLNLKGASCDFEIGKKGIGTFYMTGGDVNIDDKLKLGEEDGTGRLYLDGGTIVHGDNELIIGGTAGDSFIDITEGTIYVEAGGSIIEELAGLGKIKAYGGSGTVDVNTVGQGEMARTWVTARPGDPNEAWGPTPLHLATVPWTPDGPTLSWNAASEGHANSHDVYFGTDFTDVNDANRADDPCNVLLSQGQDPCTFAFPAPLPDFGETYYWRIDEVNESHPDSPWKGVVWNFTIEEYEVVEDFESYSPAFADTWALKGPAGTSISLEDTIVHGEDSDYSMKYVYDTNVGGSPPFYTEADANTTGTNKLPVDINDWGAADVNAKALTLYFYGRGNNNAVPMYVGLRDGDANNLGIVYYDNPNDLVEPEWHEWNIKLTDFSDDNDVNLRNIDKVYIGFGDRENPTGGGEGTAYFDDIQLYPNRCVPAFGPLGDVDNDCDVDFFDVNEMAGDWLEMDSVRVGSDGVLVDFNATPWVDGKYNYGLLLDGIDDWVDLDDSDFSDFRNKTIAFWVKVLDYPAVYPHIFYFSDEGDPPYRIYFMTHTTELYQVRGRFVEDYSSDREAGTDWHHLAFTVEDTDEGSTGTFYFDGLLVQPVLTARPRHYGGATGVNIGSQNDGVGKFVKAVIDEFRVYDKALDAGEVYDLYDGNLPDANMLLYYDFDEGSGTIAENSSTYEYYHPLLSDAELYEGETEGSRAVNFMDFAILANDWFKEQLWP